MAILNNSVGKVHTYLVPIASLTIDLHKSSSTMATYFIIQVLKKTTTMLDVISAAATGEMEPQKYCVQNNACQTVSPHLDKDDSTIDIIAPFGAIISMTVLQSQHGIVAGGHKRAYAVTFAMYCSRTNIRSAIMSGEFTDGKNTA